MALIVKYLQKQDATLIQPEVESSLAITVIVL
jgi:hypothetical protein